MGKDEDEGEGLKLDVGVGLKTVPVAQGALEGIGQRYRRCKELRVTCMHAKAPAEVWIDR